MKTLIIVLGLGESIYPIKKLTENWNNRHGLKVIIYKFKWNRENVSLEILQSEFNIFINESYNLYGKLNLLGISAGGSCIINAFLVAPNKIDKVINLCGRLRKGDNVFPSLSLAARGYKSFYKSVIECESNFVKLPMDRYKDVLTIKPLFDETVPISLVSIPNCQNITIPSIGHIISIYLGLSVFKKSIIEFLLV